MSRIVVTGGGTGGHLYPALAVCEVLQADPAVEALLYIGNKTRKEAELVPAAGIAFVGLTFSGMPRRPGLAFLRWLWELGQAFREARRILQDFRPHAVLGTGGYITAPVLLAANSLGLPTMVHEPDAHPGLVNRFLSQWAAQATCAFDAAQSQLKARQVQVTGNPLRTQIGTLQREDACRALDLPFSSDKPTLLVMGGSQGARQLNRAVLAALPSLVDTLGLQILHQTGEALYAEVQATCPEVYRQHPAYRAVPFIADMGAALALADLALCRAGSMTLSEMYRAGIPTILVPYPYAAQDHQHKNALASQAAGASLLIADADLTGPSLIAALTPLCRGADQRQAMAQAARTLAKPDATAHVVALLLALASSSG